MRKRKLILVALGCLVLAAIAVLITRDVSGLPVDIRFVSSATHGATRDVTVEFRRSNPDAFFYDTSQVQTRVAGHWSPLQDFPDSQDFSLLATKNCENLINSKDVTMILVKVLVCSHPRTLKIFRTNLWLRTL